MTLSHGSRKHSKFSASGSERWFACPGSVALSEGLPDRETIWSKEGTKAHEVLEMILNYWLIGENLPLNPHDEMFKYGVGAANFILGVQTKAPRSELLIETRITLDFIHPEMFGTFDGAVIDHFGTLHVFDYKYGAGRAVIPNENLQMIFYGLGLAHKYDWNFKKAKLWIIQPRVKSYEGPLSWELPILDLKAYVPVFKKAVDRVLNHPGQYKEGAHCHWCKAKTICPLKQEKKLEQAKSVFSSLP